MRFISKNTYMHVARINGKKITAAALLI